MFMSGQKSFLFFYYEQVLFTISGTGFTTASLCGVRKKYDL